MEQQQAIEVGNNTVLATVLQMCGESVTLAVNEYSHERLLKTGRRARDMHKDGIPGRLRYFFANTDNAVAIIRAFDEENQRDIAGERFIIEASELDAARIIARYVRTQKRVSKYWQDTPSLVKRVTGPKSFTVVSMNADAETIAHLE